jgi:BirA family biotin operon repressor/biotin-[acetyl-CoA-carboxylase] ligase
MLGGVQLTTSAGLVPRLQILDTVGSTNDVLIRAAADGAEPNFSTVVTLDQTAGRGRLGRVWVAPPGKTLAASVLLRPVLPAGEPLARYHFGWLPLIAGASLALAVDSLVGGGRTGLKWPNDVQIDGLKVSGILSELVASGDAVVIGAGVNLTLATDELPVPTATSLALAGVTIRDEELVDALLAGYLEQLRELVTSFLRVGADADASGIHQLVSEWCSTLGREVRVELPGSHGTGVGATGGSLVGVATGIDPSGRLQVRRTSDGAVQAVAAGDVTHLRYE